MWCSRCQQDVPAVASGQEGGFACARCRARLGDAPAGRSDAAPKATPAGGAANFRVAPPPRIDDWRMDEDLREAGRLIASLRASADAGAAPRTVEHPAAAPVEVVVERASSAPGRGVFGFSWLLLGLGLATLVCGASLCIWSLVAGRPELWTTGLPVALVGQTVLAVGLLLQLDRQYLNARDDAPRSNAEFTIVHPPHYTAVQHAPHLGRTERPIIQHRRQA